MEWLIVGIILLLFLYVKRSNKIKEKQRIKEEESRKIIENKQREEESLKKEQEEKLEEEEKKRIEEQSQIFQAKVKKEEEKRLQEKYEKITVVYKISEYQVIVKRNKDNTYFITNRRKENPPPKINEIFKIEVKKADNWDWFSEEQYGRKKSIIQKYLKKDFYNIYYFLKEKKITKFYHFTDRRNLENIKRMGGLHSWEYLFNSNNKESVIFGSNEMSRNIDKRYNLQNYVRLSFCKEHPMMFVAIKEGRIQNPVILEIDIRVAILNNTLFSNMNATDNHHKKGGKLEDLKNIKFDVFQKNYFELDDLDKKYYQAEVLVEKFIPLKFITNFNDIM